MIRTTEELLNEADKLQTHMEMTDQMQVAEIIEELSSKLREREKQAAKRLDSGRKHHANNKEKRNAYTKEYKKRNIEKVRANARSCYAEKKKGRLAAQEDKKKAAASEDKKLADARKSVFSPVT